MSLVLDATVGSASANAYCTRAEADAYHLARVHSDDWTSATTTDKDAAIVMATRLLDSMYEWDLFPVNTTQALQWPRAGIPAANKLRAILPTEIPVELKNATAEFARQLIVEDRSLDNDVETQGLTSLRAGSVALTFKNDVNAKIVPDAVVFLLPPWWGTVRGRSSVSGEVAAW